MTISTLRSVSRITELVFRLILGAILAIALTVTAQAQARQQINGTTVSLMPLEGFAPSNRFAGLESPSTRASLVVVEFPPEAHDQLSKLFGDLDIAKTGFAKQNIIVSEVEAFDTQAGPARLITGQQNAGGTVFDKWIALLKGAKTVMITVQAPEDADLDSDDILAMLKSVSLGAPPSIADKVEALPFTVAASAPFRIVDTIAGSGVMMMAGELNVDPAGKQPLLIVAYQLSGKAAPGALEVTAEAMLRQTRDFQTARIAGSESVTFAGRAGLLLTGTFDHANGTGKRFAQYMAIASEGRFVRLLATAEPAAFEALQPAIAAVAASVSFKPDR
jgi:hypothetical protein